MLKYKSAKHFSSMLKNKIAIITGGSDGIGKSTVQRFVEEGAKVIIADTNEEKGLILSNEINKQYNNENQTKFVKCDISNESDCENLSAKAIEHYNKLDILVNNAGIFILKGVEDFTKEEFMRSLETNVVGPSLVTKYAVRYMKENEKSSIVNLGSISSFVAQENFMTYSATKAAVLQITKNMALDLNKYNIRVNCVCPGTIVTSALINFAKENNLTVEEIEKEHWNRSIMGRFGTGREVADSILFLASDQSSYITGTHISVDGGYLTI